ncbi:RNA polymerase sigma factor, partial [Marivita cryptomonadis]
AHGLRNPPRNLGCVPPSAETPGMVGDFPAVILCAMDTMHLTRLRARARRLTRSPQDAEDLCHEVCLAILEQEALGARIARPLPYMMTALRHAASARSRRMARETPMEAEHEPQVEDAALACLCSQVLAHMDHLPAPDRALLRRVAFEGVTPSELAQDMDVPVGTIMSRLARARARLRDAAGIASVF